MEDYKPKCGDIIEREGIVYLLNSDRYSCGGDDCFSANRAKYYGSHPFDTCEPVSKTSKLKFICTSDDLVNYGLSLLKQKGIDENNIKQITKEYYPLERLGFFFLEQSGKVNLVRDRIKHCIHTITPEIVESIRNTILDILCLEKGKAEEIIKSRRFVPLDYDSVDPKSINIIMEFTNANLVYNAYVAYNERNT